MSAPTRAWVKARAQLGDVPLIALGILLAGLVALIAAVRPLEARVERLNERLGKDARRAAMDATRAGSPSAKLAAFYGYFDRREGQVDWLAKLYGSARGAGIELRTAEYRLVEGGGRIARYEITLPLTGSYAQIRAFLANVLDDNPILSLDQLNLRRKRANDSVLEAEAVLTVHLLRP
ncbi:MAG: GspMb/PilO family protein [Burkholderiales bacterium]